MSAPCSPSRPEQGTDAGDGPQDRPAGSWTVLDAMQEFIAGEVGWDAGEPMRQQAGEALAAVGFVNNIEVDALVARLALTDDDLAAIKRLRSLDADGTVGGIEMSTRGLLAYLTGGEG